MSPHRIKHWRQYSHYQNRIDKACSSSKRKGRELAAANSSTTILMETAAHMESQTPLQGGHVQVQLLGDRLRKENDMIENMYISSTKVKLD